MLSLLPSGSNDIIHCQIVRTLTFPSSADSYYVVLVNDVIIIMPTDRPIPTLEIVNLLNCDSMPTC
jgi:hypothetical protein